MELTVLGCEGSGPSRQGPASGYLVTADNRAIWLDAGTGTFMALAQLMDPADLDAVVLSHMHPDHSADIFGLIQYLAHRVGIATPIPAFMPADATGRITGFLGAELSHPRFRALAMEEVGEGEVRTLGEVTLRFAVAEHSVPTVAVRIEHAGRALAYSADTGPGGGFPSLAAGADVVLCEAGLVGTRGVDDAYPYHLDGTEAGKVAAQAGAGRLILTHLAPSLTRDEALLGARAGFEGDIDVARPGLRIAV